MEELSYNLCKWQITAVYFLYIKIEQSQSLSYNISCVTITTFLVLRQIQKPVRLVLGPPQCHDQRISEQDRTCGLWLMWNEAQCLQVSVCCEPARLKQMSLARSQQSSTAWLDGHTQDLLSCVHIENLPHSFQSFWQSCCQKFGVCS